MGYLPQISLSHLFFISFFFFSIFHPFFCSRFYFPPFLFATLPFFPCVLSPSLPHRTEHLAQNTRQRIDHGYRWVRRTDDRLNMKRKTKKRMRGLRFCFQTKRNPITRKKKVHDFWRPRREGVVGGGCVGYDYLSFFSSLLCFKWLVGGDGGDGGGS